MLEHTLAPTILVDGVFFQIGRSGIARVWTQIFQHWLDMGWGDRFVVVDRQRTLPRLNGMRVIDAPAFQYGDLAADQRVLQQACDAAQADVFISTYYTTPLHTPSLMMVHDMIPEVLGWDLTEPMWRQKQSALAHAQAFVAVSHNTAADLRRHLAQPDLSVSVCHNGCDFQPAPGPAVEALRQRLDLGDSYFMLSGTRTGYKNAALFFEAFALLGDERARHSVLCTGGGALEPEFQALLGPARAQVAILSDAEMQAAYSGATALVYPSTYEGFGLPVLEAMACGSPVITSDAASLPEVGGAAPRYLQLNDQAPAQLRDHLRAVQDAPTREAMVKAGLQQAAQFSWRAMAEGVANAATQLALSSRAIKLTPTDQTWFGAGMPVALPLGHAHALNLSLHKLYARLVPHLAAALPPNSAIVHAGSHHGQLIPAWHAARPDLSQWHLCTSKQALAYLQHNALRLSDPASSHGPSGAVQPVKVQARAYQPGADLLDVLPSAGATPCSLLSLDDFGMQALQQARSLMARDHPLLMLQCRAGHPSLTEPDAVAALRALQAMGYVHLWVMDNHGNPMLADTTVDAIGQLLSHIARQDHEGVSRTMYHLDVLATVPAQAELARQAVARHLNALR